MKPTTCEPPKIEPGRKIEPLYFGCVGGAGHYIWDSKLNKRWWADGDPLADFLAANDGAFPPKTLKYERSGNGKATLRHFDDFTVLAFWDQSIDSRPASNSAFLLPGVLSFEEAVSVARTTFPSIWGRFSFKVEPWEEPR